MAPHSSTLPGESHGWRSLVGCIVHGVAKGQTRLKRLSSSMERVTWRLILPYVKQIANGKLLYGSGNSNRGSVST